MAFTLNRRLSTLVDSSGQLKTGKIPNDYIDINHIADNSITTAMLHTGFTLPISSLTSIDTDDITEGSTNLFYTDARVDSHLSGGTGVTYSSGEISIGQAVSTSDSPTFADLTITGNLNITGDINSYNVTDLDITDQTITLGAGQIEANSGGSGIIIDGASASILWDETNDQFDFNKGINIDSDTLVVDGTNNRVGILQASPAVSLDVGSATDALFVPKGTTAERPTGVDGYFRYNTDDAQFEGYADGAWGAIAGSGGGAAMETDNFTGDGSTTDFTLTSSVSDEDNLLVFIEGVYQNKVDYVASGTTLTFDVAPVSGRNIVAYHVRSNISGSNVILTSLTGDGSTVAFTLTAAPGNENNTQVFMDGVYQQKDSYITSGTTLTFDAAPENGTTIEVISYTQTTINEPTDGSVTTAKVANEAITSAKIDSTSTGIAFADLTVDTDTLVVDATNNRVGIGTSSPAYKIDSRVSTSASIVAGLNLDASGNNNGDGSAINFSRAGNILSSIAKISAVKAEVSNNETDLVFSNYAAGSLTEKMRIIGATGNVGIGNTSPLGKLTISNAVGANAPTTVTTANTYLQLGSDDYGPNNNGKFMIGFGYTDATNTHSPAYIGFEETSASGDTKGQLTFYTRGVITDTAPSQRMRITDTGATQILHGGTTYYTSFEDQNEINTYTSAGANSTMYLQHPGGDLEVGAGIFFVDRSASSVGIGTTAVTSPGLWYDGANDYLAISHWASPPTPAAMLHLSDNSNDLDVPQIRIEGRENLGDTRLDISVKDAAVRLNLIEGTSDASNGYGQMIFKTNAAANTGAVSRGGFKFDTPASSNSLVVTNTAGIGFGTDNPFSYGGGDFEFYDASSSQTGVRITSSASSLEIGTDSNGGYIQAITPGDGMSFLTANSSAADVTAMKMNSGGIVTTPQNPAFRAYLSTEQTANGTVTSGYTDVNTTASRAYDRGGNFNISNGRFTAPVDGVYVFSVMWDSLSSQAGFNFLVNGTDYNVMWEPTGLSNDAWESKYYGTHLKLSANDYVQLTIVHASGTNPVHQGNGVWGHFAGALIG